MRVISFREFGKVNVLEMTQAATPEPGPQDILVKVVVQQIIKLKK